MQEFLVEGDLQVSNKLSHYESVVLMSQRQCVPKVYMQKPSKATAMTKAMFVCTMRAYSSGLKNTAEGEKWLAFCPLYFFGPVMFITRYPGIQPSFSTKGADVIVRC